MNKINYIRGKHYIRSPRELDSGWNRCDVCGKFIALKDFDRGAVRNLIFPDSDRSVETWETLCTKHTDPHP